MLRTLELHFATWRARRPSAASLAPPLAQARTCPPCRSRRSCLPSRTPPARGTRLLLCLPAAEGHARKRQPSARAGSPLPRAARVRPPGLQRRRVWAPWNWAWTCSSRRAAAAWAVKTRSFRVQASWRGSPPRRWTARGRSTTRQGWELASLARHTARMRSEAATRARVRRRRSAVTPFAHLRQFTPLFALPAPPRAPFGLKARVSGAPSRLWGYTAPTVPVQWRHAAESGTSARQRARLGEPLCPLVSLSRVALCAVAPPSARSLRCVATPLAARCLICMG